MVNQQKGVQQDTAYSGVVVNDSIPVPISFLTQKVLIYRHGRGYHSLQLQYLLHSFFADLPSL